MVSSPPVPAGGRQRILDAAAHLFLERGYADTSLRDIGAEAGLQAASIYHHFASKDELLEAVLRRGIELIGAQIDEVWDAAGAAGARDGLFVLVRAHLRALFELGPYTAANVVVFPVAPPAVRSATVPDRDAYEARWDTFLRGLAEGGHLAAGLDVAMARRVVLGAVNSSLEWFRPDGPQGVDELAGTITELVWSGIGGERRVDTSRPEKREQA